MIKKLKKIRQKITRDDVRKIGRKIPLSPKDLFEPTLSDNAVYIAKTRYAFRNEKGEPVETPKEMFWRIAYYIGTADRLYSPREEGQDEKTHKKTAKEFYELMASQRFIPNTPTLVNSGKVGQSLSACFVLPVEDDMESILKTMRDMAMIHKMGGGTGFSFSRLRPKDDIIGTSKGKSTGPVAFLQAYNDVTSQIRQGGVRRGANMGILHYTHPDVLRFAVHKVDEFSLTNFNISVTVTEDFMEKVKNDAKYVYTESNRSVESDKEFDQAVENIVGQIKEAYAIRDLDLKNVRVEEGVSKLYELCRSTHKDEGYDLINPRTGVVTDRLNAKKFFNLLTRLAWQYGDPGMILIDRVNNSRANPTPNIGLIEATNPCAEQPLLPYDACTLGSINLSKFVEGTEGAEDPGRSRGIDERVNWQDLKAAIHTAIHFLDNVLDMNEYPVEEIAEMTAKIRRVGLGVMGWADMLVKLGIGYDAKEGFDLAEKVMQFVQREADNASCDLAKIRGVFPAFKGSIYDKPARRSISEGGKDGLRVRNAARTTIAPTGTISLLADCSSGIEPHFALTYAKNTIEGKRLFNTNPYFMKALKTEGLESEELLAKIEENHGSIQSLEDLPEDLKKIFVVAGDISPDDHVRMAAAFQKFTDNGISKTINFPNEATVEDVRQAYWLSYELGCNMITIYRDGSRVKQVLEVKKGESYYDQLAGHRSRENSRGKTFDEEGNEVPILPRKKPTPQEAWGMRVRKKADVGYVYTSVFRDGEGDPVEVFVTIGKTGGYVAGAAEITGRLASRALKYGATLEEVASDLVGISCGTPYGLGPESVLSAFDAVGKSLLEIARTKQLQLPEIEDQAVKVMPQDMTGSANGASNGQSNGYSNGHPKANGKTIQMKLSSSSEHFDIGQSAGLAVATTNPAAPTAPFDEEKVIESKFSICPDCSSPVVYMEGCRQCINPTCGWSKCS